MDKIKYAAMFDELEKISEDDRRYVTKEKFKRHLKTLVPVSVGAGIGTASGLALRDVAMKHSPRMLELAAKHPRVAKFAPLVPAALGAVAGHVTSKKSKLIRDYVEGNGRSEQHSSK